jgi:tetratricopeptide (TPR) repeat protein
VLHKETTSKTDYATGTFALDGEEVWQASKEGVLHFDGRDWRRYTDAAPAEAASIVAGGGEVWIIDHTGRFLHFKDGEWQSQTLAIPGVTWTKTEWEGTPELARTADGAVWLVWQGAWRLDGENRVPLTVAGASLQDPYLVGVAGDRLWLSTEAGLLAAESHGSQTRLYGPAETGLEEDFVPGGVTLSGDRTLFATYEGVLEFDGANWLLLPGPEGGESGVRAVAAGPDGSLWMVAYPPESSLLSFRYAVLLFALLPLAAIGVVYWIFARLRKRRLRQHQRVSHAVKHATGDIPEELEMGERKLRFQGVSTVVMIAGSVGGYALLRTAWPKAPVWILPLLGVTIHVGITLLQSLVKRKPKPSDPIGPGAPSRYNWSKTVKAAGGTILLILVLNADLFPALGFLRGYTFWLLILVPVAYHSIMGALANRALKQGDYEGALRMLRLQYFYNPSGVEGLRITGHLLLLAGRYREAEETLRRSLSHSESGQSYGQALEHLGEALMEQGRYDEAMRSYEAALHAFSWRRRPYRGMAELLLRRGQNPVQALEYVEKITDLSGLSWVHRQGNSGQEDDYWSLKAWALARLGRSSEVAPAIESARKASGDNVPDLAATHYRSGMALLALGQALEGHAELKKAADLDPKGRRGALANEALRDARIRA